MSGRQLVDISGEVLGETERALHLYDGTKTEWVPKSQVEDNGDGTFTMPEWLAKEKGFI
jgi:RNase P/RNase MRP subunit p29